LCALRRVEPVVRVHRQKPANHVCGVGAEGVIKGLVLSGHSPVQSRYTVLEWHPARDEEIYQNADCPHIRLLPVLPSLFHLRRLEQTGPQWRLFIEALCAVEVRGAPKVDQGQAPRLGRRDLRVIGVLGYRLQGPGYRVQIPHPRSYGKDQPLYFTL